MHSKGPVSPAESTVPPTCLRFYVLDDEPVIGESITRALTNRGMTGSYFTEADRLLAETARRPPDLIVLDLTLKGADAAWIMLRLEALGYRGRLLLMSGWLEAALRDGLRFGQTCRLSMLPPLVKPFRLNELYERVAVMLQACAQCQSEPRHCAARVRLM
jgi:DNA-binding response OmpR family regulator